MGRIVFAGMLIWSIIRNFPRRMQRIGGLMCAVIPGTYAWFVAGFRILRRQESRNGNTDHTEAMSQKAGGDHLRAGESPGNWLVSGLTGVGVWFGRMILTLTELPGLGEILQIVWGLVFRVRPLTSEEQEAYAILDPSLSLPVRTIRIDADSFITRINGGRAVASMYIVHLPDEATPTDVVMHELAHVRQYEEVGVRYMFEALHAQFFGAGYDYGDLAFARSEGSHYSHFNREQQAQICQDYYRATRGEYTIYGASREQLEPYIADYRMGRI
ncbi:MAG TPA: hypothetical protein VKA68_05065 [bacterium]|nr:hypothetical protein [bacterium]